ncbi:MAG: DUF3307 domain-containing protein [Muribaculaceae bacterium]|nr:DUF3307 domain-containing protein [Muribaculaceae bacterium]
MTVFTLLISLLVCHFLADFCLTTSQMIEAKATGKHLQHIVLHAAVHAVMMGVVLLVFGVSSAVVVWLFAFELITHLAIDYGKGFLGRKFMALGDNTTKPFWVLYGFDQLLHLMVVVAIVYFALS